MILQNPPVVNAVSKEQNNENGDRVNDSLSMQLGEKIVQVENIQPAAAQPIGDNYEKTNDEFAKNDFEPEKAPHNVQIRTADDPIEKKSEVKIGQQDLQPDDPSKDLGGPIGDEVVHDLGDKEADDGDRIQELQPVQQVGNLVVISAKDLSLTVTLNIHNLIFIKSLGTKQLLFDI